MNGDPDLDREDFAQAVANRLSERAALDGRRALELAEALVSDMLDHEGVEFGAESHAWTRAEAVDLADEELFEWERA